MIVPGTRLGPYELTAPIGAGGMGEVWRARDTRLDRSVAIKVLPKEFAADAKFRLRLEREAKAISGLTHPNICTLYDVGHQDGVDFLVMELLDGETLADRLERGPLPLSDVVRYGSQIAEALERAHREGIVHRDLKPGNIMLTKSGSKLLDFGLAKAAARSEEREGTAEATQQKSLTAEGNIVGTIQYMAPEQLEGAALDHRADIFALGAVLYEMATGRRAFNGATRTSIIAAILTVDPPPVSQVQKLSPPLLDRIVQSCLAKDREQRTQSAHDVALQLGWLGDSTTNNAAARPRSSRAAWAAAALMALLAAAAGMAAWKARRPTAQTQTRFIIESPAATGVARYAAISADGRRIVFRTSDAEGRTQLWLRDVDSTDAKPLSGTEGAAFSFWAPDGKQIAFQARGKLLRMNVETGEIRTLAESVSEGCGGSWNANGVVLFSPRPESVIFRVNAAGGEPVEESHLEPTETYHTWPWFLPDGEHYLFMIIASDQKKAGVYVGKLGSRERTRIQDHPARAEYSMAVYGGGSLFYVRNHAIFGQRFDWKKPALVGPPVKVDEELEVGGPGRTTISASAAGTLLYKKGGSPTISQLTRVDRAGKNIAPMGPPGPYYTFALSPDEKRIAVSREDLWRSAWIIDAVRGTLTRTAFERHSSFPQWLSDSRSFVVCVSANTPPNVFLDRRGTIARLTRAVQQNFTTAVSADDKYAFFNAGAVNGFDIMSVEIAPPHRVAPVIATKFSEYDGHPSPDGRWLAYVSAEGGPAQVYVTTFPPSPQRWQISDNGGELPRWSRDGRELYFLGPNRTINAVKIDVEGGELRPGILEPLFAIDNNIGFEPTREGHFLVARTRLNPDAPRLTIVQGWSPTTSSPTSPTAAAP